MLDTGNPSDWGRPSHAEIRTAIGHLGEDGFDEIREALTGGPEPFNDQMNRRMATRRPELRPAYRLLRTAGEKKVRQHLAATDHEGLKKPRSRRRKKTGHTPATASR